MITQQSIHEPNTQNNIIKTCTGCTKFQVCLLIKSLTQVLAQHFKPEHTPIQPSHLAIICNQYLNQSIVTQMTTTLNSIENTQKEENP